MMEAECTSRCCSKKHADYIFSAITKDKEHEEKVLNFLASCSNVAANRDSYGRNALHVAASLGRVKIIQWLLSAKDANVHVKDSESGYSPLHRAVYFGQLHAARSLLNCHANLFQTDNDYLSSMDHLILDRFPNHKSADSSNPTSDVYVWGSNNNYSLGIIFLIYLLQ